jgi:quercetin dioxygenase-like cupin family protein
MEVTNNPSAVTVGPPEWFTGTAYMKSLKGPTEASRLVVGSVEFTPGARTFWHSHPHGQTLIVTEGIGLVGRRGGVIHQISVGDVVVIEPGEEHWHGADSQNSMTHLHINEVDVNGTYATFCEPVSEAEYLASPLTQD